MNILIVAHTFPLDPDDGTAHFMLDFAEGFTKLGHRVTVFLPFHSKLKAKSFKKISVKTFRYMFPDRLHALGYGRTLINNQTLRWFVPFLGPLYLLSGFFALKKEMARVRYDIVSAHWILPGGLLAALVSRVTGTPLVITLPGTDVYVARMNVFSRALAAYAVRRASVIISNSPQLLNDLGVKGLVIPYGVPALSPFKRKRNHRLVVAAAGRIAANKNFGVLTRVVPDAQILRGLTIKKFRKKLRSVDIFVAPSIRDSKGNLDDANVVVLEAMAAGCAVITSDLPGYRTIIHSGLNGLLVKPNSAPSLYRAIIKLKNSARLRSTLGRNAQKSIQAGYTTTQIAKAYITAFRKAVTEA